MYHVLTHLHLFAPAGLMLLFSASAGVLVFDGGAGAVPASLTVFTFFVASVISAAFSIPIIIYDVHVSGKITYVLLSASVLLHTCF